MRSDVDPQRRSMRSSFIAATLLVFALGAAMGTAAARHRSHAGGGEPGEFAYYLLSLSWSPAFCLSSPGAAECNGPRRFGFIVHGLWPQNERGWPENCDGRGQVSDDVVQDIADLMPASNLVRHEWSAHGRCSGLGPPAYFALLRRAYSTVAIPQELSSPAQPIEQPPEAVADAFLQGNPRFPAQSIVVTCSGQGVPRLREVHVCLDRELTPRACSADVLRGACRAARIIITPIR